MAEHTTKSQAEKTTDSAIADIVESIEAISTEVQAIKDKAAASLTGAVKEHPYVALSVAASLGFLLSRLL